MKILVTGGTGFIGSHLAASAIHQGHSVHVLGLVEAASDRANAAWLQQMGVDVFPGSITDRSLCVRALEGVAWVYHLAVAMREAGVSDDHYLSVNLEGTECLLEAASQAGVTKFIYCGTIGIFGHRFDGIAHEDSPKAPGNIYEETKLAAESLALDYYERYRLPVVSLRPADVYGPRDQRLLKLFRGVAKGRFPLFGTGRGRRHMVYVDDVVSAFEAAAVSDRAVGKPIIIAGPEICTLYDLIDEIRRQVGRKSFGSQLPLGPVVKVAALTEDLCIQFGITPPLYRRRMDFFTSDAAFDISRAKALLGWEPKVGLREGVRRTLHDYCRAGLIDLPAANPCDTDE